MKPTGSLAATDRLFRAFADRTRLRILHLLLDGELCVCDLVGVLKVPQPRASRHLAYLRRVGLVTTRKVGLWSFYSLAPARGSCHAKLLECLACCFADVPGVRADRARARRVRNSDRCCSRARSAGTTRGGGLDAVPPRPGGGVPHGARVGRVGSVCDV